MSPFITRMWSFNTMESARSAPRKGVFVRVVKVWDWRQFVQVRTYLGFVRCADFLPQVHLVKLSIKV